MIFCHHLYYLTSLVRELCPQSRIYAVSHGTDLRQLHKNPWERDYILREIPKLDGIFALHEAQKQEIAQIFSVPAEQIRVIGTGYNRNVFHPFGERQDHGTDPDVRLLYAGKICEKKGVLSLLRAVNKLEPPEHWKLALAGSVGDPEEYARIRKTAETVSPAPVFLGMLSHQKLAEAMNQSDIFVLPSFFEGLPLVLVEAMACGMRVVCTDLPGIRQWLDHEIPGHGVVFVTPPAMQNQDLTPRACRPSKPRWQRQSDRRDPQTGRIMRLWKEFPGTVWQSVSWRSGRAGAVPDPEDQNAPFSGVVRHSLCPDALTKTRCYNKIDAVRLFEKGCFSGSFRRFAGEG